MTNNGEFLKNTPRNCDCEFAVNLIKALGLRILKGEYLQYTLNVTVHCSQFLHTLLVIVTVICGEFLQHTIGKSEG